MSNWIHAAETALTGPGSAEGAVDVLTVGPPPVLDAAGIRALLSPFLAGFLWAATIFRELQAAQPFDPLALLLRLLALALSVRALVLLSQFTRRLRLWLRTRQHALVLTDEGLLYRSPSGDVAIPRADILDVRERGRWGDRGGRRFAEVYVVTRPASGRTHLSLPPLFERTPGVLVERLMRWLGPRASDAAGGGERNLPSADPNALPSKLWEEVARGAQVDGVCPIPHGSSWVLRGPYASVLLGLAVLEGFIRLPQENREAAGSTMPLVLVGALIVVPVAWFLFTRAHIKPRLGLALILTPAELLMRLRSGVMRVAWGQLAGAELDARAAWSILLGAHEARALVLRRKNAAEIRYHESFLGVPVEVVASLCEAYRKGAIEP
jgi:hypothetical protein